MQKFKTLFIFGLISLGFIPLISGQNLDTPVIDSITVKYINNSGWAHLNWQLNPDQNIYYRVYRERIAGNGWDSIPPDIFYPNSNYLDTTSDPCSNNVRYLVEARNPSGLQSGWNYNFVKPPFLKSVHYQPCNTRVSLEWSESFPDITRKVVKYQIIAWVNNSTEFTVLADDIPPGTSNYSDLPVQPNLPYSFAIRAFDDHEPSAYSSTSCIHSLTANPAPVILPESLTIISAGTGKTGNIIVNKNIISWKMDTVPDPPVKEFRVWRSTDGVNYENIATVEGSVFSFSDIESDPTKTSYYYKVEAIDQCDFSLIQSDACKTIHLDGKADYNECRLDWTKFIGPVTPVDYYIYMILDGDFSNPIFQTPAIKDTFSIVGISGFQNIREFGFYIQTRTTTGNPSDISRSNYITLSPETNLILPSAFDPGSSLEENRIFKPRYRFRPENTNYYMGVFNKWGEQIFESKEVEKGWDGNLPDGSAAPSDVYAYIVRYQSKIGLIKELKGTVTLVR